jgi:glutamyl-tRNA synthetase
VVWYTPLTTYDEAAVAKHFKPGAQAPLAKAAELLAGVPEWTAEAVGVALHEVAAALEIGMGKVAQPLRVAITGTQVSPDISHTVYLTGREQAIARIHAAIAMVPAA